MDAIRFAYTMIRVRDLDRSLKFYTGTMGMNLLGRRDYPEGRFTLAFVGYGEKSDTPTIELTYNWDRRGYDLGNGFGHIAFAVPDVYKAVEAFAAAGAKIVRPAGPMNHGAEVIAFLLDPDGYRIEIVEQH